jgi:predicted hydrolase (HD superfamily)
MPTRNEALALLKSYNGPALVNHGLAVEAAMSHFAKLFDENPSYWGMVGLLHDLDYEKFPEQHCYKSKEILQENGFDDDFIRAVMSHGWEICTDVEPKSKLEKTLYAVDELTGLVVACALVRPSRSTKDLEVKSVKKKFKQASFASGVDREVIQKGAQMLNMQLDEIIQEVILALRPIEEQIGLGIKN